jgi:hypothetical protein
LDSQPWHELTTAEESNPAAECDDWWPSWQVADQLGGSLAQVASFSCADRHSAPASIARLIQMNISLSSAKGPLRGGSAGQAWVNSGGGSRLTRTGFVGTWQAAKESTSSGSMDARVAARSAGDGDLLFIGFLL